MASKRTFPGWGYWIEELNASTLYQNWDGSQSRNHIMFGSIGDYFYKGLAGIRPVEENPGFEKILIQPSFDNDLEWVEAGHESPFGMIRSHWKKEGESIVLDLQVPANVTAEVRLPEGAASSLQLNGKQVPDEDLIREPDTASAYTGLLVGSGKHVLAF